MSKANQSNLSISNTPPDRDSVPDNLVSPGDRATAAGGPKPDVEPAASQSGRWPTPDPVSRAERMRRR
jgi:hypothetical protein